MTSLLGIRDLNLYSPTPDPTPDVDRHSASEPQGHNYNYIKQTGASSRKTNPPSELSHLKSAVLTF